MRSKHLGRALQQLAEEGAALILKTRLGNDWIVGVAGALQFEVLADRIRTEYNIPVSFEATRFSTARWVDSSDSAVLKRFVGANEAHMADDHHGLPVYLSKTAWQLTCAAEDWPKVTFQKTREQVS